MQNENIAKPEEGTMQNAAIEDATKQEPTTELPQNHEPEHGQPTMTDGMQKDRMTDEGSKVTPAVVGIGLPIPINTAANAPRGTTGA